MNSRDRVSVLHPAQLPLPPGLYFPNLEYNRPCIPCLLSDPNARCVVVLSRTTPDLASTHFNQGYMQILPIQLMEDTSKCEDLEFNKDKDPIVLYPNYLSSFYNIKPKDSVVLYKCQPPELTDVILVAENNEGISTDGILHLISSQCNESPIPCQVQSTLLLAAPDTREIQLCEPEQPRLLSLRVESTEPFPYGYILPTTRIDLKVELKLPREHRIIRFIPHGSVDASAVMLSQRDAACLGVGEGDWIEFEVKQCVPVNQLEETEWLKIPQIDLEASPMKRTSHVMILHEREVRCLQNFLSDHIIDDLYREVIFCYVSSLTLTTNSPFHPNWYAFYGDITPSQMPTLLGNKITIREVTMPHIEAEEEFNFELEQYFATPRLVREGDLLSVPLERAIAAREDVFYVVESVEVEADKQRGAGELVWTTAMHSTLTQSGYASRSVPYCFSFRTFFQAPFMYGFERFFAQLLRYIYPLACLGYNHYSYLNNGIILEGAPSSGKRTLALSGARLFSMNFTEIDCHDLVMESLSKAEANIVAVFSSARRCRPCVLFISSLQLLCKREPKEEDYKIIRIARYLSELITEYSKAEGPPVIIIGGTTTTSVDELCYDLQKVFINEVEVKPLKEKEVQRAIKLMMARMLISPSVDLEEVAAECHKFGLGDLKFLIDEVNLTSVGRTMELLPNRGKDFMPYHNLTTVITTGDFTSSLEHLREVRGNLTEVNKIPNVRWEDIGGLEKVKEEVMNTLIFSNADSDNPGLLMFKRCGLLLHGPPGCGKTMLAKAIATETKCRFISVKGPEILDKYIGQSEKNIRDIFDDAIESAPCVVFFDEIDSIAPRRGSKGDSGGVMNRVASQLLTELDRVAQTPNVYVVAATNRPDLLDPAFLRPGRFDRSLHVGFSDTPEDIEKVFRAITKKFNLSPDVDLREISGALSGRISGSEVYSICYEAMMGGVRRKVAELEAEGKEDGGHSIVTTREDFVNALKERFKPNVKD